MLTYRQTVMKTTLFVLTLVMQARYTFAAPSSKGISCPPEYQIQPCTCREVAESLHYTCRKTNSKRLADIVAAFYDEHLSVTSFEVTDSHLLQIPDMTFEGLEVKKLVIRDSNVSTIEDKAFTSLTESLKELVLDDNRIKEVPSRALSQLTSTTTLRLSNNKIGKLSSRAFENLVSLRELHLNRNDIDHIDGQAFEDCCGFLEHLDLSNNLLTSMPSESLAPLVNLTVIKLDGNFILSIEPGTFKGLFLLNKIDLSNNFIATVADGAFENSSLHSLILKYNNLTGLSRGSFDGLQDSMEWLDLSYNGFESIPADALENLRALKHLDLAHNYIVDVDDDSMLHYGRNLRYLELNDNKIQHISPKAFRDLESLEILMLASNNLTRIEERSVDPILDRVFMLDLSDNPLECSCELQWLQLWLQTVDPLDRRTPDPTCLIRKARQIHFVRNLPCKSETEEDQRTESHCTTWKCTKSSLISFLPAHLRW